ncbi:MAG: RNA polymerase-associated protein RapA [Porticoccaceae bacterium]|nr:RNA polymerase-associated protein RapA [Porticoccaceae bacterium]
MKQDNFRPGQRWVSHAEPEAGLGIVVEMTDRRVVISFPAIGEQRTYASDSAPLSRVRYQAEDVIRSADEELMTVVAVEERAGLFFYQCRRGDGQLCIIDELELDSFVQFSKPQDRLFSGQVDSPGRFRLRRETREHRSRLQKSPVQGLLGARVQLLAHQMYIASEVAGRHAPRVLLADEVGLGKTIEAGLIVHQQLVTGRASRVLIVVPDSLVHQWLVEMLRRFNLLFTVLDEARCLALGGPEVDGDDDLIDPDSAAFAADAVNPFESAQFVLCSLSFLVNDPERLEQARAAGWDLLVVDEAHHLRWQEQGASAEYCAIEHLAAAIPGLLLLTATPEQLGVESHFARLKLLDPHRYGSLEEFKREESRYREISDLVQRLMAEDGAEKLLTSTALADELGSYLGRDTVDKLQVGLAAGESRDELMDEVIGELLDHHGTGRVLFRNTRDAVSGFPERRFFAYPLSTPETLSVIGTEADLERLLCPETLLGDDWLQRDPRVAWLSSWLSGETAGEKVLVICARADTARQLADYLDIRAGIRSAAFHEGMTLIERDRAAAYFADSEGEGARVLVCSEIGSEGRNFQFARHLVLFDLPFNPDLLEQRIGRLDRIGQRHDVNIHLPHYDTGLHARLARWYHEGLDAFERVCPVGGAVMAQLDEPLRHWLLAGEGDNEVIDRTRALTADAMAELQAGRDRLLELNSCHPSKAEQVMAEINAAEDPQSLAEYMIRVFDRYGVEHSHHSADALVLMPTDHLRCDHFPGLPEDGVSVTFNRNKALSREDLQFLSWEHPMVSGAMDMILGSDFGNVTLCTLKLPGLKPGMLLVEALYALHCAAPAWLQLHRWLPAQQLRLVVDSQGQDLSGVISAQHLDRLGQKVDRASAQAAVTHARPQLTSMIQAAEQIARDKSQPGGEADTITPAVADMERAQALELSRLRAMAKVNPNVRSDEIDHVIETTAALRNALSRAEWRLDAIRVAVTV